MSDDSDTDEQTPDEEEFEAERTATRAEAAAVLRGLADGVDAGAVAIDEGEDAVTVAVPDEFGFELEYEREDDEVEIEVELEWQPGAEPAVEDVVPADANEADERTAGPDDRPAVETATVATADTSETTAADDANTDEGGDASGGADAATGDELVAEPVVEAVAPVVSQARFELFRDRADEWRWRLVHRNGNVIASSGEGYTRKHNAENGLRSVMDNAPEAEVVED